MTTQQFQDAMRQAPFKPFTIHMADGRVFHVSHPDFVARSPTGQTVIVYGMDGRYSVLDLSLMSELEVHAVDERAA